MSGKKKVVVLANGCFDPFHYGHLMHFRSAREFGDELVVSVTSDEQMQAERGVGRVLFNEDQRVEVIKSVRLVDWTVIVNGAVQAIQVVKPQVFVKGPDYFGRIGADVERVCKELGVKIMFTRDRKWSATAVADELRRG